MKIKCPRALYTCSRFAAKLEVCSGGKYNSEIGLYGTGGRLTSHMPSGPQAHSHASGHRVAPAATARHRSAEASQVQSSAELARACRRCSEPASGEQTDNEVQNHLEPPRVSQSLPWAARPGRGQSGLGWAVPAGVGRHQSGSAAASYRQPQASQRQLLAGHRWPQASRGLGSSAGGPWRQPCMGASGRLPWALAIYAFRLEA